MRDTVIGRILMYLGIWVILFVILCIISVIKNWSILVAVISSEFMAIVYSFVIIGIMVYGIAMIIRAAFR